MASDSERVASTVPDLIAQVPVGTREIHYRYGE